MKHRILFIAALLFATLQTFAQTYTYDNLNRLTKVVYSNGTTITYTYDALGNRLTKKVTGATSTIYTITTAVTPAGSGSVTGGGTYVKGSTVELYAIPNAGYEFQKWNDGVTANPRTVTVSKNISYKAYFNAATAIPDLHGDIVVDGKVNNLDIHALVDAYLSNTQATQVTDLDNDGTLSIADITSLVGIVNENKETLKSNGHKYVDLGLPSGALWATCNVGATTPLEFGDFYAWGETEPKDVYNWETYIWCNGDACTSSNQSLTKYCDRNAYGKEDGKLSLELDDDAAHVKWGGDWHIPTTEEFQELMDYCTFEYDDIDEAHTIEGFRITGPNGNSIIMPATGYRKNSTSYNNSFYYWSANLMMKDGKSTNGGRYAACLGHVNSEEAEYTGKYRYCGYPVRPVLSKYTPIVNNTEAPTSYMNHDLVDLGLPSGTLWATCNLGASKPEGYGCYYAWGETTSSCNGKTFTEDTYKYYNGSVMTKYTEEGVLDSSDDAATFAWGGAWRMPTRTEITELENEQYTTCEWTQVNGVYGCRITSIVKGFEGNSIFLPAAGQGRGSEVRDVGEQGLYWGSSIRLISEDYPYESADCIRLSEDYYSKGASGRWKGFSIRPVVSLDAIK